MDAKAKAREEGPEDALFKLEHLAMFGNSPSTDGAERSRWGLALSGGGVRSATYCLGVLQGLADCKLLAGFHYLSTVSGGGYIGGFLQGMLHRHGMESTVNQLASTAAANAQRAAGRPEAPDAILHLRQHSNFLAPDNTALSNDRMSVVTNYLSNLLLLQVLVAPVLISIFIAVGAVFYRGIGAIQPWLFGATFALSALGIANQAMRNQNAPSSAADPEPKTGNRVGALGAVLGIALICSYSMLALPADGSAMLSLTPWFGGVTFVLSYLAWVYRESAATVTEREMLGAVLGGVLVGFGLLWLSGLAPVSFDPKMLWALTIGAPLLYVIVFLAGALALGFSTPRSGKGTDRMETWARASARFAVILLLATSLVLVAFLPNLFQLASSALASGRPAAAAVSAAYWLSILLFAIAAGWGLGVAASVSASSRTSTNRAFRRTSRIAISVAPWALIIACFLLYSWTAQAIVGAIAMHHCENPNMSLACQLEIWNGLQKKDWIVLGGAIGAAAVLWYRLYIGLGEQGFSMNAFYRSRLVRCYLTPSCLAEIRMARIARTSGFRNC